MVTRTTLGRDLLWAASAGDTNANAAKTAATGPAPRNFVKAILISFDCQTKKPRRKSSRRGWLT
jgi:hypothetical protein